MPVSSSLRRCHADGPLVRIPTASPAARAAAIVSSWPGSGAIVSASAFDSFRYSCTTGAIGTPHGSSAWASRSRRKSSYSRSPRSTSRRPVENPR